MSFIEKALVKFRKKKIGTDAFGNQYFVGKEVNYLGKPKRFVIYKDDKESSKVPPMWHAWLHYLSDDIPGECSKQYDWQQDYVPNLTGTKLAYNPQAKNSSLKKYSRWIPNN
ncbi:MAG: NADH-ubiquinone oxidoreductase subunit NDUFA12 family protein [Rickettsiaceae bacterium]|nr:NADH-ubiquinone oxidoreductase subunit NDUFA12 family protein [Rickettsiaceae bacterium]